MKNTTASAPFSPKLVANKDPSLADELIHIEISDLTPQQKITLHASIHLPSSAIFESFSHYIADDNGCISLKEHESLGGDYKGVEPMGPFSFMRPSPLNQRKYARFLVKDPTVPFQVDFRVFDGFLTSLESAKNRFQAQPHSTITRTYMSPGVKEIPVWDGNVRGTLYVPPGKGPFPGVISMSGGYPGAMKYKAALLASHGFTALALKYFGEDDLPDNLLFLELEYIEEAANFLINHHSVAGRQGIGIVGNCFGGILGWAAASVLPEGLIRCVASTSGGPFPFALICYKGEPVAPIHANPSHYLSEDNIRFWKVNEMKLDKPDEIVKSRYFQFYDKQSVSYLLVAGGDDGYFCGRHVSHATKYLLENSGHPDYKILFYEDAGHLIEHSFCPFSNVSRTFQELHAVGGKQPYHSIAQNDSWPKILDFIHERLSVCPSKL